MACRVPNGCTARVVSVLVSVVLVAHVRSSPIGPVSHGQIVPRSPLERALAGFDSVFGHGEEVTTAVANSARRALGAHRGCNLWLSNRLQYNSCASAITWESRWLPGRSVGARRSVLIGLNAGHLDGVAGALTSGFSCC